MTREEAIKNIKKVLPMSKTLEDAFYILHPELCENEDERVRKEIVDFIQWAEERGMTRHDYHQAKRPAVWIAYLEKQKNLINYYEEKLDRCACENLNKGIKEVLNHLEEYGLEKQKEQKPVEYLDKDKVYAIMTKLTNLSYSQLIPINSDEFKKLYEITSDVRSLLDYPIEQKPAIEQNLEFEKAKAKYEGIVEGKQTLIDNPEEYGLCEQAEWSEEDKLHLNNAILAAEKEWGSDSCTSRWLKSFRPQKLDASKLENYDPVEVLNRIKTEWPMAWEKVVGEQDWKPSEEQMKQLKSAADLPEFGPMVTTRKEFPDLESLYEHFLRN